MEKKISPLYKIVRWLLWVFYPKMKVVGAENLPDEPCIIVGNHSQMDGPIGCELYFPGNHYTWCDWRMMKFKEVPAYSFEDFWSQKPKYIRWFFKIASYVITPLSVLIFNNANTIPVYRDRRIIETFKISTTALDEGNSVIIFPECAEEYNNIIYNFQTGCLDIGKFYYKKSGKELNFVPLYIAPRLKTMYIGKPIKYSHSVNPKEEKDRICKYLMKEITDMATALPRHRVVPYRNIKKKDYPYNKNQEVD